MNKKAQLQVLLQPRMLIIIVLILGGYLIAPEFGLDKELGILIGMVVGFFVSRYL